MGFLSEMGNQWVFLNRVLRLDIFLKDYSGCYAEIAWKVVGVTRFREGIEATAIIKESSNTGSDQSDNRGC